jgi:hypothetical protein
VRQQVVAQPTPTHPLVSYQWFHIDFGTGSLRLGCFAVPYVCLFFVVCIILFVFISQNTQYGKAASRRPSTRDRYYTVGSSVVDNGKTDSIIPIPVCPGNGAPRFAVGCLDRGGTLSG